MEAQHQQAGQGRGVEEQVLLSVGLDMDEEEGAHRRLQQEEEGLPPGGLPPAQPQPQGHCRQQEEEPVVPLEDAHIHPQPQVIGGVHLGVVGQEAPRDKGLEEVEQREAEAAQVPQHRGRGAAEGEGLHAQDQQEGQGVEGVPPPQHHRPGGQQSDQQIAGEAALPRLLQEEEEGPQSHRGPGDVHIAGHRGVKEGGQGQHPGGREPIAPGAQAAGVPPDEQQGGKEAEVPDGHEIDQPGGPEEQGKGDTEQADGVVVVGGEDGLIHPAQGGGHPLVPEGLGQGVGAAPVDGAVPAVNGGAPPGVGVDQQVDQPPQDQDGAHIPPGEAPQPRPRPAQALPQGEEQVQEEEGQQNPAPRQDQQVHPPGEGDPAPLHGPVQHQPPEAQGKDHAQGVEDPPRPLPAEGVPGQMAVHRGGAQPAQQGQQGPQGQRRPQRQGDAPGLDQKGRQAHPQEEAGGQSSQGIACPGGPGRLFRSLVHGSPSSVTDGPPSGRTEGKIASIIANSPARISPLPRQKGPLSL